MHLLSLRMTNGMADFSVRSLRGQGTLGERLRKVREEQGDSLDVFADRLQIPLKYLEALEEGRYADLPSDVYIKSFLRSYALALNVNAETVIKLFESEYDVYRPQEERKSYAVMDHKKIPRPLITPTVIRRALIVVVILSILTYLGFEARRIIAPPFLVVNSPASDVRITERSILVEGTTEPEASVVINDETVIPDESGRFSEEVALTTGVNTIVITAKKPRSAERRVVRTILVVEKAEGE